MTKLLGFFTCLLLVLSITPRVQAVPSFELPPWWWADGSGTISANFDYLSTKANYTEVRGGTSVLPSGNGYTSYEGTLSGRYAFHPAISVYAGFGYANAMVVDGATNKNNAAISNGFFGADFKLPVHFARLIPEIEAGFSGQQFDINGNVPLTSDGTPYLRATMYINKPFHIGPTLFEPYAYLGFYYPTQDLAKLFIYGFGGELYFTPIFAVGGGLAGYETMIADTGIETDRTRIEVDTDGGSFRYDAYNPASASGKAWVRLNFAEQFTVRATYAQTFSGIRSAFTQTGSLYFSFDFPEGNGVRSRANQHGYPPAQGYYGQPAPPVQPPPVDPRDPHEQQIQNQRLFNQRVRQGSPDSFEADDFPEAVAPAQPPPQQPVGAPAPPPEPPVPPQQRRQVAPPPAATQPSIMMRPRRPSRRAKPQANAPAAAPAPAVAPNHSLDDAERALEEKRVK